MTNSDKEEMKIMMEVLKKLESTHTSILLRSWFTPLLWVVNIMVFLVAFRWYEKTQNPLILVFVSFIVGVVMAHLWLRKQAEIMWPYIGRHINVDSVRNYVNQEE